MYAGTSLSRSHKCHNYPTVISVAARGAGVWPTCAQSSSTVLILDSPWLLSRKIDSTGLDSESSVLFNLCIIRIKH